MSRRRARHARRRPHASARWCRPRRRRALRRFGDPGLPGRHARRADVEDDEIVVLARRAAPQFLDADGDTLRARGRRGRLGRGDRREGRLRDVHAQGDPRAGRRGRRDDRRPPARDDGVDLGDADRSTTSSCATSTRIVDRRLRHLVPRRPDRPLRDRGVGARPGRDRRSRPSTATATRSSAPATSSSASPSPARPPTRSRRCGSRASAARPCSRSPT